MSDRLNDQVSLWLNTEGGMVHYACGDEAEMATLGMRFREAGIVCEGGQTRGPCCRTDPIGDVPGCWADEGLDDLDRRRLVLAISLCRAEDVDLVELLSELV